MITTRIKDILIPLKEYPSIRDNATLRDAFAALHKYQTDPHHSYRHVLVLDEADHLVGQLGMHDLLRGLLPEFLQQHGHFEGGAQPDYPSLALIWQETCETQCQEAADKPVLPFLGTVKNKVRVEDPLTLAAYFMATSRASILPVIEGKRVIGVVRLLDVFNSASKVVLHD
jgi:CBS domain-containing protein